MTTARSRRLARDPGLTLEGLASPEVEFVREQLLDRYNIAYGLPEPLLGEGAQ
jgi:hypothetical protein